MGWKNWPSWLKGGVIGVFLVVIYAFIFYISGIFKSENLLLIFTGYLISLPNAIFYFTGVPLNFDPACIETSNICYYLNQIYSWLRLLFLWAIIGAIIGWIVGKIRNKTNLKTRAK